jgi:hypothetical protein
MSSKTSKTVDQRLSDTAAVMFVIGTDNPNEPEGTWSVYDLSVRLGRDYDAVQRAIDTLTGNRLLYSRYVGGTSRYLYSNHIEGNAPSCWGVYDVSLTDLEALPVLTQGQADDLKIDGDRFRVWLSRCSEEDGEPWNNRVSVEMYVGGSWIVVENYQAV